MRLRNFTLQPIDLMATSPIPSRLEVPPPAWTTPEFTPPPWTLPLAREQDSRDAVPVVVAVAPQQLASALSDVRPGRVPLRLHVGERFQVDIAEDFAAPVLRRLLDVLAGMERSA